jgi:aspartyl-tRNA(Asn)/glutamyl-tRNA(Gln) amidotransferase subunit B
MEMIKEKKSERIENDEVILAFIKEAISTSQEAFGDYKKGKVAAIGVIIGKVIKLSGGRAEPKKVQDLLEKMV